MGKRHPKYTNKWEIMFEYRIEIYDTYESGVLLRSLNCSIDRLKQGLKSALASKPGRIALGDSHPA